MYKKIEARFYKTPAGNEPVREWLKSLDKCDCKIIGEDVKTVELGWPIGMPSCKALGKGLYEVRSSISGGRIARVIFTTTGSYMVLLHGFIKKSQQTSKVDMDLSIKRMKEL